MTNIPDVKEVTNIDTQVQLTESDIFINDCKSIYERGIENDLVWRWKLGEQINKTYADAVKYESSILKRLSETLDIAVSDLSRFRKFYNNFTVDKVVESANRGFSWSHFKIVNDLPDGKIKEDMKAKLEEGDKAPKTKDLQQEIDTKKEQQVDGSSGTDATSSGDAKSSGPGDKTHRSSPVRPVNSAIKAVEKLCDFLGDVIIAIGDGVDFDSEKQQESFNEKFDELKLKLDEVVAYKDKLSGTTVNGDKVDKAASDEPQA